MKGEEIGKRKGNEEDNGRKGEKKYILPIKLKFRCGHHLRTPAMCSVETGSLSKVFLNITRKWDIAEKQPPTWVSDG